MHQIPMSDTIKYHIVDNDFEFSRLEGLGSNHYSEVEKRSNKIPFDLDTGLLQALIKDNKLVVILALKEEEIVGYYASFITKDLFSKENIAQEIAIYVKEDLRDLGICTELFRRVEEELVIRDVFINYTGFKKDHNEEFPIKLGYRVSEIMYEKVLR